MKLFISFKNEASITENYSNLEGNYILASDLKYVNGKEYWIQENECHAIWYDKENDSWNVGVINNLGSRSNRCILKTDATDNKLPHEIKEWDYFSGSGGGWVTSTFVKVQSNALLLLHTTRLKIEISYFTKFLLKYRNKSISRK